MAIKKIKNHRTRKNITRYHKTKKYNKKQKIIQYGGERVASTIEDFINLINSEEQLNPTDAKNLATSRTNTYYQLMVQRLPCSMRFRDMLNTLYSGRLNMMQYNFDSNLILTSKTVLKDYKEDIMDWGSMDIIKCIHNKDNSYKIIMGDYDELFKMRPALKCDFQINLISLSSYDQQKSGHAIILLVDYKMKTFTVIDPNGGGTTVEDSNLDDIKFSNMFGQIFTSYSNNPFVFPACQKSSYRFTGSCLLWSQLYIDLILRFGLENARIYLDTLSNKPITHDLILKYANYISKFLKDYTYFIDDWWYILAGKIRPILYEISRNLYTETIMADYLKKINVQYKGSEYQPQYIRHPLYIVFSRFSDWKIELRDETNFVMKHDEYDQQIISTILKKLNFSDLYDKLNETLVSISSTPIDKIKNIVFIKPRVRNRSGFNSSKRGYIS